MYTCLPRACGGHDCLIRNLTLMTGQACIPRLTGRSFKSNLVWSTDISSLPGEYVARQQA